MCICLQIKMKMKSRKVTQTDQVPEHRLMGSLFQCLETLSLRNLRNFEEIFEKFLGQMFVIHVYTTCGEVDREGQLDHMALCGKNNTGVQWAPQCLHLQTSQT